MTDNGSARIDHYLLGEMDAAAQEEFESALFADDEMYFTILDRENEIVDRYAAGTLEKDLAARFEHSLLEMPARRQKLANAKALKIFVAENMASTSAEEIVPWYRRLGFAFRMPAYAAAALSFLLIGMIGFLLVQNSRQSNTIAELRNNDQIEKLRQRESELQAMIENERTAAGDLTSDLENERERRTKLEAEIAELKKPGANSSAPNDKPLVPTIATIVLRPAGMRGGPSQVRRLELGPSLKRVSIRIEVAAESIKEETVSVLLNGETIARNSRGTDDPAGLKILTVAIPVEKFRNGMNRIEVTSSSGSPITDFSIMVERK